MINCIHLGSGRDLNKVHLRHLPATSKKYREKLLLNSREKLLLNSLCSGRNSTGHVSNVGRCRYANLLG